jgi:alanyl-tRNA synthetase
MTIRLYYAEPRLRRFEARVVEADGADGQHRVWLDRTAFYPTSGGQPHDTGTLGSARVADVVDAEDGRVVHVLDGPVAVGERVPGEIDWERRFDHMQQHTGQHVLSAAFERIHGVRTESFRLGGEASTIDLAREVTAAEIGVAEEDANRVVWEARPVSIRFVSEAEAARLPLRKESVRSGRLRLVEVEEYDLSACGGTHVSSTAEIGLIAVRGFERFRKGTRVEFVCGLRALYSYRAWRRSAAEAAKALSIAPAELPAAVERLQEELRDGRRALKALGEKTASLEASGLAAGADQVGSARVLVRVVDGYDVNALKALASAIVRSPAYMVVLVSAATPVQVVAARSADVRAIDCSTLVPALTGRFGGRGGGKADAAQAGGLNGEPAVVADTARALVEAMFGQGASR